MTSFSQRYVSGEHEAVWRELRALGPVPLELQEDVAQVATVTMRRVAGHVARPNGAAARTGIRPRRAVAPTSTPDGWRSCRGTALSSEIGGLSVAFDACLREVGSVHLPGDWDKVNLHYHHGPVPHSMPPGVYYPDPLCLPDVHSLRMDWEEHLADDEGRDGGDGFHFALAPDELHKANISGGTHDVVLPSLDTDPVLLGVAGRPGITLVEYLRTSISWGGFPGWSFSTAATPPVLGQLAVELDF